MIKHIYLGEVRDIHVGYVDDDKNVPYYTNERLVLATSHPPIVVRALTDYPHHTRVFWQAEEDTVVGTKAVGVKTRDYGVKSTACCFFTVPKTWLVPIPELVGDV